MKNQERFNKNTETKIKNGTTPKDVFNRGTHPFGKLDQTKGSPTRKKMEMKREQNNSNTKKGTVAYERRKATFDSKTPEERKEAKRLEYQTKIKNGTTPKDVFQSGKPAGFLNRDEEKNKQMQQNRLNSMNRIEENGKSVIQNAADRRVQRAIANGKCLNWNDPNVVGNYNHYRKMCVRETLKQPISTLSNYEKRGLSYKESTHYHLDHIISIKYGFEHKIPPEIIGNINNLRFIPWLDNIVKGAKLTEEGEILLKKYESDIANSTWVY